MYPRRILVRKPCTPKTGVSQATKGAHPTKECARDPRLLPREFPAGVAPLPHHIPVERLVPAVGVNAGHQLGKALRLLKLIRVDRHLGRHIAGVGSGQEPATPFAACERVAPAHPQIRRPHAKVDSRAKIWEICRTYIQPEGAVARRDRPEDAQDRNGDAREGYAIMLLRRKAQ